MGKAEESCRRRALKALGRATEHRHGFKREERAGLDHEEQSGGARDRQERTCLSSLYKLLEDRGHASWITLPCSSGICDV